MAPYSSTLAWKIPWTWMEEPGRLQFMGLLGVRHNWATSLSLFMHWRRKWQPTPVFLPENPREGGASWAAVYGVAKSRTWLKWLSSSSWCSRSQSQSMPSLYPGILTEFFWNNQVIPEFSVQVILQESWLNENSMTLTKKSSLEFLSQRSMKIFI